jgi:signal transduction histidine kinase
VARRGSGAPEPGHLPVEPGKGAGGYVLATGRPFRTGDYGRDPRISRDYARDTVSRGIVSMLVVPVGGGQQVEGLLYAASGQPGAFTDQDEVVLARLADYAALAVRNARRQQDATTHRGMLQALTDELSRLQEEERARLSREIHDELGQTLTGVRLALEAIQADLVDREPARTQARRAMEAVEEALREVQRIANDLRPFVLDFLGLTAALQRQAERVTALTGLRVEVAVEGQPRRLHPQAETLLYRVAQEALTNVVKHAGARSARCRLRYGAASVDLSILDDGRGFDPDQALDRGWREGRLGLVGLRDRVQRGGGVFAVLSQPGRGTCVSVQLPTGAAGAESPGEATDAADPGPHR